MAMPNVVQTLLAAFSFGLVTQAAGGAIFLHSKNHVRVLLRDSRRLVLILFFLLAILWASTQFIDLFLPSKAFTACYTIVILSTLFDQLARVAFHQYILWAIGEAVKSTLIRLVFYVILVIRLLAGGVLLGFTRPEFSPSCVARRSNIYGSVIVLALDGMIVVILATRLYVVMKRVDKSNMSAQAKAKERALIFGIFGFMIWTGTGIPMILGFPEFILLLITLLPAIGVLIVIGIISLFSGFFVTQSQEIASTVGAISPYTGPIFSSQNAVKASAGSPSSGYMQSRSLYVVNPSTPYDSPTPFSSGRGIMKTNENTPQNSIVNMSGINDSAMTFLKNAKLRNNSTSDSSLSFVSHTPGYRGSSGIFPPQGNNQAALAPAIVGESGPNTVAASSAVTILSGKRSIKWPLKISPEKKSIRNLPISNPISIDQKENGPDNFVRMPTVELEQAIFNKRQRNDAEAAKSYPLVNPLTQKPPNFQQEDSKPSDEIRPPKLLTTKTMDVSSPNDDKEMTSISSKLDDLVTASEVKINQDTNTAPILTPNSPSYLIEKVPDYNYETSRTTSVLPSPIPDELRRRSPMSKVNLSSPVKSIPAFSPKIFSQPMPNSQFFQQQDSSGIETNSMRGTEKIMLVNEIIYDRPDIIKNIMKDLSEDNSGILRGFSNMLEEYSDISVKKYAHTAGVNQTDTEKTIQCTIIDEPVALPSVIDRPRPIERRMSRVIISGRRRSKSLGAIKFRTTMAGSSKIDLDPLPLPPPLPTRAANLKRLLHEDTNNMAGEEERIKYLFPAPPLATRMVPSHKRNLSLPSLAQLPSYEIFQFDKFNLDKSSKIPIELEEHKKLSEFVNESSKLTYQTTIISYQDQSQVNLRSLVPEKFDDPTNASISSNVFAKASEQISTYNKNIHNYQSSSKQTPIEDDTIDWDWLAELDSLEMPKNHSLLTENTSLVNGRDFQEASLNLKSEDQAIVTLILDTPIQKTGEWSKNKSPATMPKPGGNSQLSSTNQKDRKITPAKVNQKRRKIAEARDSWFCRVGERIPSFSGKRNEVFQTNKIPPPLALDRSKIANVPKVQHSELTPPHHSYESVDVGIQSPFPRLEEKKRGNIELLMQQLPKISLQENDAKTSLLKNLEMEMEEQSNQWQNLQNYLDRDSFISVLSQLPVESLQQTKNLKRSSDLNEASGLRASNLSTLSNLSQELSTDTWHQHLTEAQTSYTNLYNQRPNHFKFSNYQISSPTPPESIDSENGNISQFEDEDETPRQSSIIILNNNNSLWRSASPSNKRRYNSMWNTSDLSSTFTDVTPPAANLRPPKRFTEKSLSIESHSLWFKEFKDNRTVKSSSSWLSEIEVQKIPQNPGEKFNDFEHVDVISDSQVNNKAHIKTMDNVYEDMENFSEYEEKFDESTLLKIAALLKTDNLPSNKSLLPPRKDNHLEIYYDDFPKEELSNLVTILPLTINENFSTYDTENSLVDKSPVTINKSILEFENVNQPSEAQQILKDAPNLRPDEQNPGNMLWNHVHSSDITIQSVGLQQPSSETWRVLNIMPGSTFRSKSRKLNSNLLKFEFDKLWAKPQEKSQVQESTGMWINYQNLNSRDISTAKSNVNANEKTLLSKLWTQRYPETYLPRSVGLQQPSPETWEALIAMLKDASRSKPRILDGNLPRLKSQNLWIKPQYVSLAQRISGTWEKSQSEVTEKNLEKKSNIIKGEIYSDSTRDHQIVESKINHRPIVNINNETQNLFVIDNANSFEPRKDLQATKIKNELIERPQYENNEIIFESMLWSPGHHSNIAYESFGLQQPSSEAWKALNVIAESFCWSKSKPNDASLPKFGNEKLWVKKQQLTTPKHEATDMWITKKNSKIEEIYKVETIMNSDTNEKFIYSKLWTNKNPGDLVIRLFGLQQPSPEAWRALTIMPEKCSRPKLRISKDSLPVLKSDSLWAKQRQVKRKNNNTSAIWTNVHILETKEKSEVKSQVNITKKTIKTMLWKENNSADLVIRLFGLQQPSPEAWRALTIMPEKRSLPKLRVSKDSLPVLKSDSLWAKKQKVKTEKNDIRGIWKNEEKLETQDISKVKSPANFIEKTLNSTLWTQRNFENINIQIHGLQQPSSEAWRALICIPEDTPRSKLKTSDGDFTSLQRDSLRSVQLNSTKLWSLGENSNEEINWISRCCMMLDQKSNPKLSSEFSNYLWKKKTVISKASFIGINSSSNFRASIRQTGLISNATSTTYRTNYFKFPSDQLTSKKLWEKTINIPIQRDWISESSVRPESPTFSASSSLPSSPISDASSIFSISTKASSIWAVQEIPSRPVVSYIYPPISEGNSLELKSIYDGHRVSKSSIGPKIARPTPLAAVLESKQQFSQTSLKIEANQTPKHTESTSRKYRKSTASEYKYIKTAKKTSSFSKSKSNNPLTRTFAASPAEWKSALTEAILAGNTSTL